MNQSLRPRAATVLLLALSLAGSIGTAGVAQTTQPGATAPGMAPSAGSPMPAPGSLTANMPANGALTAIPKIGTMNRAMPNDAQAAATGAPGQPMQPGQAMQPGQSMQQMADQRITDLHARLHITPKQEGDWQQFASVMRGNAKDLDDVYQDRASKMQSMNAVDNMRSYADIEQMRAADIEKLVPAFQTLYASLSPSQQHAADALFRERSEAAEQRRTGGAAPPSRTLH